jgi:hypothetical protein
MLEKGGNMAHVDYSTDSYKTPVHHRILANMPVRASWVDKESGETVHVEGLTENVGETSTLVNLEVLPPVGSQVKLKILDEEKTIIEVSTQVIRVERDRYNKGAERFLRFFYYQGHPLGKDSSYG